MYVSLSIRYKIAQFKIVATVFVAPIEDNSNINERTSNICSPFANNKSLQAQKKNGTFKLFFDVQKFPLPAPKFTIGNNLDFKELITLKIKTANFGLYTVHLQLLQLPSLQLHYKVYHMIFKMTNYSIKMYKMLIQI